MNQEGLSVKKLTEEQSWLQTGALLVLAFVAFSFGLSYARAVLVPFTLALFLNYLVAPIVDFQMIRLKFSRFIAVSLTLLMVVLVLVLMAFLGSTVVQNVTAVANDKAFMAKLEHRLEGPLEWASRVMDKISGIEEGGDTPPLIKIPEVPIGETEEPDAEDGSAEPAEEEPPTDETGSVESPEVPTEAESASPDDAPMTADSDPASTDEAAPAEASADDSKSNEEDGTESSDDKSGKEVKKVNRTQQLFRSFMNQIRQEAPQLATQAGATLLNIISSTVLTSIFVGFLLAGRDPYKISKGLYAEIDRNVRKYIATKFFISGVTGLLVWGCLSMIGMQFASMFGLIAFCLNFIPSIGSIIATLLPIPIAIVQFDSPLTITLAIALPGAVQMIMGNVIEPKIMGDGLQLHPATILLALAFFGMLWGPVGMLLAAPITASVRIVLMRFKTTQPIGRLMAGTLPEEDDHLHHV
ncbi:AI-2E family transporter [Bremerella cremea]|uniref:AI-2E family transporter n=1 Tax=Bremerella cremea TaxID=1031537 RepID=UPI0031EE0FB3